MLRTLEVRDILIIDRLDLEFRSGLNVLTGETGAGKSILLDCLGFVLGWRGRAELVRQGAEQGEVTAVFDLPPGHPAHAVLSDAGLPDGEELILRRVNAADGRKTAYVNDRRTSGEVLRALSDTLVELHGQHDDRGLLNPRGHRAMLDAFAGVEAKLSATRAAWTGMSRAAKALDQAEAALAAMRGEEDFLRHAVAELDKLDPAQGEEAELDARRRAMQAGERIRADIARALQALSGDGAEGMMSDASRWLEGVADRAEGRLDPALAALSRAQIELGEAAGAVESVLEDLAFDPRELEAVEERLFAIRALARKHNVLADDLGGLAADLRQRLAALDGGEENLRALQAALHAATATYDAAAAALGAERAAAALRLDQAIAAELAPLNDGARGLPHRNHRRRGRSRRPRRRGLHRRHQPWRGCRAVEQDRLGRGAFAVPSGAEGLPDARRRWRDDDLRRNRPRRRWRHRRCGRAASGTAGGWRADPCRHPQPAGRGAWRPSLAGGKAGEG